VLHKLTFGSAGGKQRRSIARTPAESTPGAGGTAAAPSTKSSHRCASAQVPAAVLCAALCAALHAALCARTASNAAAVAASARWLRAEGADDAQKAMMRAATAVRGTHWLEACV